MPTEQDLNLYSNAKMDTQWAIVDRFYTKATLLVASSYDFAFEVWKALSEGLEEDRSDAVAGLVLQQVF